MDVVARRLADLLLVRGQIEKVVRDLERHTDVLAVGTKPPLRLRTEIRRDGAKLTADGEKVRRLLRDAFIILLDIARGAVKLLVLDDLARAQIHDELRDAPRNALAEAILNDEKKSSREEVVARENRLLIAPHGVRRHRAAPRIGMIEHVVMDERRHVDQFERNGERHHFFRVKILAGACRKQKERRAQPLAAGLHKMRADLRDAIYRRDDRLQKLFFKQGKVFLYQEKHRMDEHPITYMPTIS